MSSKEVKRLFQTPGKVISIIVDLVGIECDDTEIVILLHVFCKSLKETRRTFLAPGISMDDS